MTIRNEKNRPGVAIIVAVDEQNGIGRKGGLLCHLPADLKHFKEITTGHAIIMGRKTYESLPKGALPNRRNIVLTSDKKTDNYPGCIVVRSLGEAFASSNDDEFVFIIGGERVYRASLPLADMLYMTRVHHTFDEVDTFFPEIDSDKWVLVEEERHERDEKHPYSFSFQTYIKKSNEI
ncbi:MAG: dihydrofolate reductase [Bacteroidota bacterium]|jgi:dihydrofolate reductase|nr:dihydrofolate reductase [Bacteroidota bacterium]